MPGGKSLVFLFFCAPLLFYPFHSLSSSAGPVFFSFLFLTPLLSFSHNSERTHTHTADASLSPTLCLPLRWHCWPAYQHGRSHLWGLIHKAGEKRISTEPSSIKVGLCSQMLKVTEASTCPILCMYSFCLGRRGVGPTQREFHCSKNLKTMAANWGLHLTWHAFSLNPIFYLEGFVNAFLSIVSDDFT